VGSGTVRVGYDTWVGEGAPSAEHGTEKYPRVSDAASAENLALIYLRSPAPRGATILEAWLRCQVRTGPSTASNIWAQALTESFSAGAANYGNKPAFTATNQGLVVMPGGSPVDMVLEWDVAARLQQVADGAKHFGWRIHTDATGIYTLYGLDSGVDSWSLEVVWSDAPDKPTSLSPDAGVVSVAKPTVTCDYTDVSGGTEMAAIQVQIDASMTSPYDFDSGQVAATEPELDLSRTDMPGGVFAGVADGASTNWRVRVKDDGGNWSTYSDWATLARENKPTVTIDSPSAGVVYEHTPEILASTSADVIAYRVLVTAAPDKSNVLYDSGKRPIPAGTDIAHTLPEFVDGRRLITEGFDRYVGVRVYDDENREATPGDPIYAQDWELFELDDDGALTPPSATTAVQIGSTPQVRIEWVRATAADSWVILIDGVIVRRVENEDVEVVGTTFATNHIPDPYVQHTYAVKAVTNGLTSVAGPNAVVKTEPAGVWLFPAGGGSVCLDTPADTGDWQQLDRRITYRPLGRTEVDVLTFQEGFTGSISGTFSIWPDRDMQQTRNALRSIKDNPTDEVRLIAGRHSFPARIRDLTVVSDPEMMPGDLPGAQRTRVSFEFVQTGEIAYRVGP
jgi:hypothetical protein